MNWVLLQNSLLMSAGATVMAVGFGLIVALALIGLPRGWRTMGLVLCVAPLALPPFVVVGCWIDLLGQTGDWCRWLPLNIYSLGGAAWVIAMMFWPVTSMLVVGSLMRLDREMIDAASEQSGLQFLAKVVMPFVRSSMALASAITFVLALNQFSIPAILQVKVYSAEVWLRFNTAFDHRGALEVSWPLVLGPIALLGCVHGRSWSWPWRVNFDPNLAFRRQIGSALNGPIWMCCLFLLVVSLLLPLWQLAGEARTWTELEGAMAAGKHAVWNSFTFAAATASLVCLCGMLLCRRRAAWCLWMFFLVPGVLTGIGLILLFNRSNTAWFYQSAGVVVLAMSLRYCAVGWSGMRTGLASVDRDLIEAARLAGIHGWELLKQVYWPQMAGPVLATWYAVYVLCLWDVESVVLLMPPGSETLSVRLFNLLHYGHNAQVNALCVTLMGLAIGPLMIGGFWSKAAAVRRFQ